MMPHPIAFHQALLTDLYQLTMAYRNLKEKSCERKRLYSTSPFASNRLTAVIRLPADSRT